ncbi:hypothetical protein JX265_000223 [Neoarthrinium moseri]|uniref:Uncharacterized protein n=1 Tax=Neoarthrinium moseri TaxID=1658444 RepID=A0A9P9WYG7_9PEZI|nr:hypothetical protein JX265_000223 [Neoarthrinium moseri]
MDSEITKQVQYPFIDVVSFAFDKQKAFDNGKPLYIDAEDPRRSLDYTQTRQLVRRIIAGLRAHGLRKGETVLVHLFNNYAYPAMFLGIVGAGGLFCATNPKLKSELANIMALSQPRFIITTEELLAQLREWTPVASDQVIIFDSESLSKKSHRVPILDDPSLRPFRTLMDHGEEDWPEIRSEHEVKATPASYFLTSGTTGCPKLATLSHYSMVAHFSMIHQQVPYAPVRLSCLPLFHMFGGAWALANTIRHGQPMYIMSNAAKFDVNRYVAYIAKYGATETSMAPPIVAQLNSLEDSSALRDGLKTLRWIGVGGAPITAETLAKFKTRLPPDATLSGVYGATELGTIVMFRYGEQDTTGSVGRPAPGVHIQIRKPAKDGSTATTCGEPANASGEIFISAESRMIGYRGTSESSKVDVDWYCTGDLGRMENGKLYITGKAKDIMKVNGFQVSPTEIEAALLEHPEIDDCAVSKVVKEDGTELPQAFVVRRDRGVSEQDVKEFARQRLVHYKQLTGGVVFVTQIPKLASGKIQRHKLQEQPLDIDMNTGDSNGYISGLKGWCISVLASIFPFRGPLQKL